MECKPGIVLARQFQNLSDDSPAIVVDPDVIKKVDIALPYLVDHDVIKKVDIALP